MHCFRKYIAAMLCMHVPAVFVLLMVFWMDHAVSTQSLLLEYIIITITATALGRTKALRGGTWPLLKTVSHCQEHINQ